MGDDDGDDVNDTTGSSMPRQSVDARQHQDPGWDWTGSEAWTAERAVDDPKEEEQEDTKDDSLQAFLEESDDSDEKPRDGAR